MENQSSQITNFETQNNPRLLQFLAQMIKKPRYSIPLLVVGCAMMFGVVTSQDENNCDIAVPKTGNIPVIIGQGTAAEDVRVVDITLNNTLNDGEVVVTLEDDTYNIPGQKVTITFQDETLKSYCFSAAEFGELQRELAQALNPEATPEA